MLNIASTASVTDPLTFITSPVSRTILLPAITSTEEPAGNGIAFTTYTSSAFSPEVEAVTICASAVTD